MKKIYNPAKMELINLKDADIIRTSGGREEDVDPTKKLSSID